MFSAEDEEEADGDKLLSSWRKIPRTSASKGLLNESGVNAWGCSSLVRSLPSGPFKEEDRDPPRDDSLENVTLNVGETSLFEEAHGLLPLPPTS
jgi:hypothetical protein